MPPDPSSKLEAKLDQIKQDLSDMRTELKVNTLHTQRNTASLEEHMEQTMILKSELLKEKEEKDSRLQPLERAHWVWSIIGRVAIAIFSGAVLALISVVLKQSVLR